MKGVLWVFPFAGWGAWLYLIKRGWSDRQAMIIGFGGAVVCMVATAIIGVQMGAIK